MQSDQPRRSTGCRQNPLAASVAGLLVVAAQSALATTWHVDACSEGFAGDVNTHIGTLRFAALNAVNNDTIDLSSLQNCTISLTTGALVLKQKNITLAGPGKDLLTIQQGSGPEVTYDRIIKHEGLGTLYLNDLTIASGHLVVDAFAAGGCIYSQGSAYLVRSRVTSCLAKAVGNPAFGGGLSIIGDLTLNHSTLSDNGAYSVGFGANGGGASVSGIFTAYYSTISTNGADCSTSVCGGTGGGVYAVGGAHVERSTFSNNLVRGKGGALGVGFGQNPVGTLSISNSTISTNTAIGYVGGVFSVLNSTVSGSTIAFNTAALARKGAPGSGIYLAPGMAVEATASVNISATLTNSLFSNNTYVIAAVEHENDFTFVNNGAFGVMVTGSSNLIRASTSGLPGGTLTGSCPLLGPLRDNGGPTQTHALLSSSVAIDAGSSAPNVNDDQRGFGFARTSGLFPDIGAYEVEQADAVFSNAFEACPTLGGGGI